MKLNKRLFLATLGTLTSVASVLPSAMAHDGPALIHILLDLRDVSPYSGSAR